MSSMATRISIHADDRASAVMHKVARESETLCKRIESLGKSATQYFFAFQAGFSGISGLGDFLKGAGLAAARYETLGAAMNQAGANIGKSRAEMAAFEAQLVKSGISLGESREILTRLAAANIDLAQSAKLARTAQDLAVVGNIDSSEALNRLVHAVVSAQPVMLRTLGLAVDFEKAYAQAAQGMGKNAASLTEAEKLQIRLNAAMEAGTRYAGIYETAMQHAGKQMGSFARHWENLKTLAGGFALDTLSMSVSGVNESLSGLNDSLMEMQKSGRMAEYSRNIADAVRGLAGSVDEVLVVGVAWRASYALLNTESAQRVQTLAKEHGALNALKASLAGTTAMLGQDTAAYIANTEAAVANNRARLAVLDRAIRGKQGVIAESVLPVHAADLEAIRTRKTFERELKGLQAERLIVARQLENAETALAAATNRTSASMRLLGGAMGGLRSMGAGVLGMFGGPVGLALTAVAAGTYYFATAQSDAEKAAESYGTSLDAIEERYKKLSQGAEQAALDTAKLTESHRQAIEREMRLTIEAAGRQMEQARKTLRDLSFRASWDDINLVSGASMGKFTRVDRAFVSESQSILATLEKEGASYAREAETRLRNLRTEALSAADAMPGLFNAARSETRDFAELLGQMIVHVSTFGQKSEEVDKMTAALNRSTAAAGGTAAAMQNLSGIDFSSLLAQVNFEIGKTGLSKRDQAIVDGLIRNKVVTPSQIDIQGKSFALTGVAPENREGAQALGAALGQLHDRQQAATASGRNLRSSLSGLNDELARLTLTEKEYARYTFERKFADLRRDLGSTSPELARWAEFQSMALGAGYTGGDALAGHVRDIAKAIDEMDLDEKEKRVRAVNEEFARLFAYMEDGGQTPFSREQAQSLRDRRLQEALRGKTDRQMLADFEKEFLALARGSEAEQIASIRERAEAWREAGADAVRVARWTSEMELKYSRDATDGMRRGLKEYARDATNMGKQIEDALTRTFSGLEDALVGFVRTGKLEFADLANSIIADLARIAVRSTITGPLASGLESVLGGLVGGLAGGLAGSSGGGWDRALGQHVSVVPRHHDGGVVNGFASSYCAVPLSLFADAPRYHRGGPILAPGEVPIIAQAGEHVLTREEGAAYRAGRNAGGDAVTINIHNHSGRDVTQQTRTDNYGNKTIDVMIGDAAAAQAQKPGSNLNRVMRSVSGAQQQVVRR